jgi:4-hydroxythreonine-4-phosphate dehydrogenase
MQPRIAIIPGEPAGIGPELVAKLLAEPGLTDLARIVLIGDRHVFEMGQRQAGVHWEMREVSTDAAERWWDGDGVPLLPMQTIDPEDVRLATVSEAGGRTSLHTLDRAVDLTRAGQADAVLFAPFNKASLHLAGMDAEDEHRYIARHIGFTGYHSEVNMLDELITTRVTSHIALKDVAGSIDEDGIVNAILLAKETLRAAGNERPRIGVAALNPHAGDNGNFGTEEIDILAPAIVRAQQMQIDVNGPTRYF